MADPIDAAIDAADAAEQPAVQGVRADFGIGARKVHVSVELPVDLTPGEFAEFMGKAADFGARLLLGDLAKPSPIVEVKSMPPQLRGNGLPGRR